MINTGMSRCVHRSPKLLTLEQIGIGHCSALRLTLICRARLRMLSFGDGVRSPCGGYFVFAGPYLLEEYGLFYPPYNFPGVARL